MNILHISRTMGQGGAEKIVYQLATGMKEKGQGICVASTGGVYAGQLKKHHIPHYGLDDLEHKNPGVILRTLWRLHRIIKKEKIDIIHTHHRMAALYARILKLFYPKIKLIYTAHNVFTNKKLLTSLSLSGTFIAAVGKNVKQNLVEFFGLKEKKIRIIYNAVHIEKKDTDKHSAMLESLKKQNYLLVAAIGRLSEQKGIDVFIRAVYEVKKKIPQVKGVIIGDGEQREELEKLTSDLGLTSDIIFLGYQKYITALIGQIDLVVMPSRWEGFPLTPIEVFAMQKTVAASDIGGIREIVRNGENGLLVPKDEAEAFGEAIVKLLTDDELRSCLEKNGKADYESRYDYESFIRQYEMFYREVMSEVSKK